jgi:phenylpropionate dioxygenase-like ring-hydroxylating dioxygenase large terminal subunit
MSTAQMISPENWFVAARSDQLSRRKPLARKILGRPLVIYRTASGGVAVLEDRCPHKNVPLSLGKVRGDSIECPYHGWKFGPSGALESIPCDSPGEKLPECSVPPRVALERDGWVWVWMGEAKPLDLPPAYPKSRDHGWFELHNVMQAPVDLILENGVDCSHTGFVHKGLFRSEPTQYIRARIEETSTGVSVETFGEQASGDGKRDARLLARGSKKPIRHIDALILPHTVKVDYWMGSGAHIVTILICTPEDERTTRVYTRMGVYYPWGLTRLITPLVEILTRIVVRQDKRILNAQARCIEEFGGRSFKHVAADQPTAWLQRAFRANNEGRFARSAAEAPRSKEVTYKL